MLIQPIKDRLHALIGFHPCRIGMGLALVVDERVGSFRRCPEAAGGGSCDLVFDVVATGGAAASERSTAKLRAGRPAVDSNKSSPRRRDTSRSSCSERGMRSAKPPGLAENSCAAALSICPGSSGRKVAAPSGRGSEVLARR